MNDPGHGELRAPHISESRSLPVEKHRSDIFFAAVETTRMPMTVTDPHLPDNPIVFANRAFLEMTGYAADEVIGNNCRFLQGRRPIRPASAMCANRSKAVANLPPRC